MDEEFILVSKNKISEYEAKIKALESQTGISKEQSLSLEEIEKLLEKKNEQLLSQMQPLVEEHSKPHYQDNSEILDLLNEHQSTLVSHQEEIIKNLRLLVEHLDDHSTIGNQMNQDISHIKNTLSQNINEGMITESLEDINPTSMNTSSSDATQLQILEKLQEIELFMSNLRILLSYVKPSHLERKK